MCEFFHVSCDLVFLCYVTFLASRPFICIFMCMLELTCMIYYLLSLKVTSKQLNSHGDGGHPAFGDDSDKAGENGRVDVVPGVVVVICISHKNLDLTQAERQKLFTITLLHSVKTPVYLLNMLDGSPWQAHPHYPCTLSTLSHCHCTAKCRT